MEPAGTMGMWNLDNYQFAALILRAAQLSRGAWVKPNAIADPEMTKMLKKDYYLFACFAYIHQVKAGPFHDHSNKLWNIGGFPTGPRSIQA
jgi:serine/threonine-protein phosphatase 2A activator